MPNRRGRGALLLALALAFALFARADASAQDSDAPRQGAPSRAEVNHEVHIHLLVTAEAADGGARVPQTLDGVVRQLKASLPPSDYRLAATFINRVRDGASFDVRSAGGAGFGQSQPPGPFPPAFVQIAVSVVKLIDPASAQSSINLQQFRLSFRLPVQTASVKTAEGSSPVIQYEDMGLTTQLSVREGEPTLVGTLNTTRPGQLFAVVVTVRRAGR
ncbi:MAG TPA: hypothetical protein VN282_15640 [Pyrinomonadaceae bacterium]|nr:hypothetical protein [Pyrinomonadaceae bacterium]